MPRPQSADEAALHLYMLDMGWERYGDALVLKKGRRSILIDGAHPGDFEDRNDYDSVPSQLATIFGKGPPFEFDLLVVTHCHSDHIGCLPRLLEDGTITAKWALVADEKLGFGRASDDDGLTDAANPVDRLVSALREEDRAGMDDAELAQFIEDAANLESRYRAMLRTLGTDGTRVVRYRGEQTGAPLQAVIDEFRDFGLEVLGPSSEHLVICADAIARFSQDAAESLELYADAVDAADEIERYRSFRLPRIAHDAVDAPFYEDRPGKGAALNDQSIVLKISSGGVSALLTGDMQFAKGEVSGLDPHMRDLRRRIRDAGPYAVLKVSHHASYNGIDQQVLDELGGVGTLLISGGVNDPGHPHQEVLDLLDANRESITWVRTDANGRCSLTLSGGAVQDLQKARGRFKDASPPGADTAEPMVVTSGRTQIPSRGRVTVGAGEMQRTHRGDAVELLAKVPSDTTQVRFTVDLIDRPEDSRIESRATTRTGRHVVRDQTSRVGASDAAARIASPPAATAIEPKQVSRSPRPSDRTADRSALAGGRPLPPLLFLTNPAELVDNIGREETAQVIGMVRQAQQQLYEFDGDERAWAEVRARLADVEGVVIIGGYDVVPATRLDVLSAPQRGTLGRSTRDSDDFIVWNDDLYGDRDADGFPEVPVSRVPDGLSPDLVRAALRAPDPPRASRFSIRNIARPFADEVFGLLPGSTPILVSETASPVTVGRRRASASHVYLMLHGSDFDTTRFWGETEGGDMFEALNLQNVGESVPGIVFAGCCWGALTVEEKAVYVARDQRPTPRPARSSLPMAFLAAGTKAYIGCTGSHYSPVEEPYDYFGGPMHAAFWTRVNNGEAPARALFNAKIDYLAGMPHGQTSATGQAIERKILKQFTCLGLGW